MTRARALVAVVALLAAGRAGAPPPLGGFPAVVAPDGVTAPSNARLWAFGRPVPALDEVGFAASSDGAPIALRKAVVGCCAVVAAPALVEGSVVDVVVSAAGVDRAARFTVGKGADETPPQLTVAAILDDSGGGLVVGAEGADDTGLAGFIARAGEDVVAGPVGASLVVAGARCVDVVAVDLAGNESPRQQLCADDTDGGEGGGEGEGESGGEGEGEGDDVEDGGCAGAKSGVVSALAILLVFRRRSR